MPAKALLLPAFLLAEQAYSREACYMPRQGQKPPRAAEGFNWIVRSCLLRALLRGLQNLEALLKKVLIVEVRSCSCGVLIRGLQNLEASCEGERVVTFCIVQKVTKKHAGRSPATHDSKLCRKRFCKAFRRHVSKPVLPAKRRRKGFESVRKDSCSADARPLFFEKELLYYKLTEGCRG